MDIALFSSMVLFAFVMAGTPGPNNMLLTFSGANFGYKRSIPQMAGIPTGIATMILLMGLGLSWVFQQYPSVQWTLKILGSAYLLYLALRILQQSKLAKQQMAKPLSFFESLGFQYLNPKAWMMTSSAVASFALPGEAYWESIWALVLTFFLVNPVTGSIWVSFGKFIARWLSAPIARQRFNITMSFLTAGCVVLLWV
ncbi:LysE family translocator [Agarivorans sp. Alg241-V36]|jgi:threonine/homoserine/homoserine lactone efflux protein|uniref:LysE family translocator n=1 Tax=Agarivorans sp. Alg241-V36 TaxID=2305992 RepID=UPI0013D1F726|nr:LysE family translocator [Agarivorans sp. Alg241-V36]